MPQANSCHWLVQICIYQKSVRGCFAGEVRVPTQLIHRSYRVVEEEEKYGEDGQKKTPGKIRNILNKKNNELNPALVSTF